MTSKKISAFPDAGALDGTEEVPILQGGDDAKTTIDDIVARAVPADGSITTAKFAAGAKAPLAGAADTAALATLATDVSHQPMRTRKISNKFTAFTAGLICEYLSGGAEKIALLGSAGAYAFVDIATGVMSANASIAAISTKTFFSAIYAPTINRIVAMMTDGSLYLIDQTASPWTATSLAITGRAVGLVLLTGHDQFIFADSATAGLIRRWDCSVNPPVALDTYRPQTTDSWDGFGYDSVNDDVYGFVDNAGAGTGAVVYKIPRAGFNSTSVGGSGSSTQQFPGLGSPPRSYAIAGGYLYGVARGSNIGQLFSVSGSPTWIRAIYFGLGGCIYQVAGKLSGYANISQPSQVMRIDPNAGDPASEVNRPIDVSWGTTPTIRDMLLGTDGYLYALVGDSAGQSVYQIAP